MYLLISKFYSMYLDVIYLPHLDLRHRVHDSGGEVLWFQPLRLPHLTYPPVTNKSIIINHSQQLKMKILLIKETMRPSIPLIERLS